MKSIKIITLVLLLIITKNSIAQNDSVTYTESVDTSITTTVNQYDKLLKYFIAEKTDVDRLFKVDLFQLAQGRINLSFEKKISKNVSYHIGNEISLQRVGNYGYKAQSSLMGSGLDILMYILDADLRYYHNIDKRAKKGKNTIGFSANYFSFGLSANIFYFDNNYSIDKYGSLYNKNSNYPLNQDTDYTTPKIIFRTKKHIPNESIFFAKVGYGLQRRIGKLGYFETGIKLGVGANKSFTKLYLMPEVNVKAGFAISSLKRKKK